MNFPLILNRFARHGAFVLLLLLWLCLPAGAMAEPCSKAVATAISIQGMVETRSKSNAEWKKIAAQDTFCAGDMVRTQTNSRAALYLDNNTILRLNALSTVTFTRLSSQEASRLDLKKGIAHFISRIKQRFEVVTPYVNAAVDGTEFVVAVDAGKTRAGQTGQTRVTVLEGQLRASNEQGEISLSQGETALARAGEAPALSARVRPWDAVNWALHYPAVTDFTTRVTTPAHAPLPGPWNARLAQSVKHYRQGNLSAALAALESLPGNLALTDIPAGIYVYRATLHLATGQIPLASADLEQALKQSANQSAENSKTLALKAMIAVVQNQTDLGLKLARQAVKASPDALTPWLAQSYAQQAVFDLEQARLSVEKAVKLAPQSALAWVRLAELHLMFGQLDRALQAAQHAADIAPELARTQSVLGFAHLTRIDITAAQQAFNQAIRLDQSDPLPRLGLGLAKIRKGQLKDGTHEIETAAILDPNNALIRSYLGKAYYEQNHEKLASTEFAIAKELDAKDPTPYFYSAILKQTTNRPVDALKDLQRSIELNDQRAVYRSRLLLDQDRAARGISLSRIYNDMGMEQLALAEGWKSVTIDPSNHSAHRFLADAYSALPRHEIARVSELLQAQLLQPINITPVQPRLSATYIDPGRGLANAAMNEYTPLFERNQAKLFTSALIGNNGALGDELTVAGIYDRLSFSLGQFHSETNGFRNNNDEENNLYNVFAQFAATPRLNVQMEYRRRESQRGDLALRFDPEIFEPFVRTDIEQEDIRVGGHFVISPQSRIVANVMDVDRDEEREDKIDGIDQIRSDNQKGYQTELQYLFQSQRYNVAIGLGRYDVEIEKSITDDYGDLCSVIIECTTSTNVTRTHDNFYTYINIPRPAKVVWTLGLAYDDYKIVGRDHQNRFNPKLGVQWDISDAVRLRAAAFQTFKRALAVNQTIEPTQIAGFNQFFDDTNATTSTRYGLGLDVRWTHNIYAGLEYTHRDLEVRNIGLLFDSFTNENRNENVHRTYLYWTPTKNIALSGEYQYEKFDRNENTLRKSETHILPVSIRYFSAQGFFGELDADYVNQNIYKTGSSAPIVNDSDTFLLINGTIGYRLPKRRGSISISVRNLFDNNFNYYDINTWVSEFVQPRFVPDRYVFSQLTISL